MQRVKRLFTSAKKIKLFLIRGQAMVERMRTEIIVKVSILEQRKIKVIKSSKRCPVELLRFEKPEKALGKSVIIRVTLSRKGLNKIEFIKQFTKILSCVLNPSVGMEHYIFR